MLKRFALLLAAAMAVTGIALAPAASSAPVTSSVPYSTVYVPLTMTEGFHWTNFYSCTVDNRRVRMYIRYEVNAVTNSDIRLDSVEYETAWNGHPAFNGNAVRLDVEDNVQTAPGYYAEISPEWGGSSTTPDDMPSYYQHDYPNSNALLIEPGSPHLRARFYGVGAGAAQGRCDDVQLVE